MVVRGKEVMSCASSLSKRKRKEKKKKINIKSEK